MATAILLGGALPENNRTIAVYFAADSLFPAAAVVLGAAFVRWIRQAHPAEWAASWEGVRFPPKVRADAFKMMLILASIVGSVGGLSYYLIITFLH
jgi:hypothetical protein